MIGRWRRFPRVRQHDQSDCGAACLDAVARFHGLRVPLPRIRRLASTDEQGTNVLGMVEAAKQLGFVAKGVRAPADALGTLPPPFIAHLILPNGLHHYVVIAGFRGSLLQVMDPRDGRLERVRLQDFAEQWTGVLIILAPGAGFEAVNEADGHLGRFMALLRPHRRLLAQALLGALLYTVLGLSTAIYVQKIVDHVLIGGNRNLLNLMGVAMLVVLAMQMFIGVARNLITLNTGQHVDAALIMGYYRHLLRLPQSFFDTMRTGELISRVGDAVKIRAFINDVAVDLLVSVMIVLLSSVLMLSYSLKLGLVVISIIPLFALVYWGANRVNRRALRAVMQNAAEMESHLVESVSSVSTIKRFNLEAAAERRVETSFVRLLRSVYTGGQASIFSATASDGLSRLSVVVALWVGSGLVVRGELSPGELMSFYALIAYFTGPASRLVSSNRAIQDAVIAADRLFEILDIDAEEPVAGLIPPGGSKLELCFDDVTFRYGAGPAILKGLSLSLPPGSTLAVVGESGCGKSTLMALVHGLYSPSSGRITLAGYEIAMIDRCWLRQRVAVVPQAIHLFAGTIMDNIAVGERRPDILRVLRVSDALGISDFVEALPQGFQTPVGENGARLSGGQRQRIGLARALYLDPEILLLDEATSSLDAISESFVKTALTGLREQGKSLVLIGHRLASIADADRIVVMEQGRIVDSGTHEELMSSRSGLYRRLWDSQHAPQPLAPAQREDELVLA